MQDCTKTTSAGHCRKLCHADITPYQNKCHTVFHKCAIVMAFFQSVNIFLQIHARISEFKTLFKENITYNLTHKNWRERVVRWDLKMHNRHAH